MPADKSADLFTSGAIAKELGLPETKVKKVTKELALPPKAKGACAILETPRDGEGAPCRSR